MKVLLLERVCSFKSMSFTLSPATLFATIAIPVPICPAPTTPMLVIYDILGSNYLLSVKNVSLERFQAS